MNAGRWWDGLPLVLNVSILFPDLPFDERPGRVRNEGFSVMESWWPFAGMAPSAAERARFVESACAAEVGLVLLNTFAGDMASGERGLGAVPGEVAAFRDNFEVALSIADELACPNVHVLLGNRGFAEESEITETGLANLTWAATTASAVGRRVLIEVLNDSDNPDYVMTDLDRAVEWIEEVRRRVDDADSIGLLFDAYHLTRLGYDLVDAVRQAGPVIGHVQLADVPGRGAPGTGSIEFDRLVGALRATGYDGYLSLEYVRSPEETLDWLVARET